jgi:glyoxylase-like metal-dependent hydrolase (beta-lactamase superfamily II)
MTVRAPQPEIAIAGLHPTTPQPLPFAPTSLVRAFLLERGAGNLLIYSTGRLNEDVARLRARGGVARQYLNHWHEAMLGLAPRSLSADLVHHEAEANHVVERGGHGLTFSERHHLADDFEVIPIPGHTAGATAYLWDTGLHRLLFTGDSVYLHKGEWRVAIVGGSDRKEYLGSLELIRDLDFDVLVPWAVDQEDPYLVHVDPDQRRKMVDALLARVRTERS